MESTTNATEPVSAAFTQRHRAVLSASTVPAALVSPFLLMIPSANIASIFGPPPLDGPDDDNSTCSSAPSRRSKSPNARWQPREEDSEPLRERYVTPRFHLGKALLEYGRVAILKYLDPKFGTVDRFIAKQGEGNSKRSIDCCDQPERKFEMVDRSLQSTKNFETSKPNFFGN